MATLAPVKRYTAEDLLNFPNDGIDRWIIGGQLREEPSEFAELGMTVRNRFHSSSMSFVTTLLTVWSRTQPKPRGTVYCGEIGVILHDGDDSIGVDIAYASPDVVAIQDDSTTLLKGIPTLIVEIWSPNNSKASMDEKLTSYLTAGVSTVWIVDPRWKTVTVHHCGLAPRTFKVHDSIPADTALPGLVAPVIDCFE